MQSVSTSLWAVVQESYHHCLWLLLLCESMGWTASQSLWQYYVAE